MTNKNSLTFLARERALPWAYRVLIFFLALTGFGQMPIYKRYYLADIPGMKWVGDFYITHYIHYLAAFLFLGILAYTVTEYFMASRQTARISRSGSIRAAWIAGIVFTGICLVINNFTGSRFSAGFIIFLDLAHIGFVMLLAVTAGYCRIKRKKWTVPA